MTAEDKLTLIEYETAKYFNAMKKLGHENVHVSFHKINVPEELTPTNMFRNSDAGDFNTYERLDRKLTLFEYV